MTKTYTEGCQSAECEFPVMESVSTLPDCSDPVYTSCYCEENIYWLAKRFVTPADGQRRWDVFSVFISNPTRTVALWNQRVRPSGDNTPIIWDYHVVLALRERQQTHSQSESWPTRGQDTWIYDLDTCLPIPCHWNAYVGQTFPLGTDVQLQYQSWFRVIPGDVYLDNFASDRSHMLRIPRAEEPEEHQYISQPPSYPVICGPEAEKHGMRHNLVTHFVSVIEEGFGVVMNFDGFVRWCSTRP